MMPKITNWLSGESGVGGLTFCYNREADGVLEPETKRYLTAVGYD